MKTKLIKSVTFKDGSTWEANTEVFVYVEEDQPTIALISKVDGPNNVKKCKSINLGKYLEGFDTFTMDDLEEAVMDGICPSLTGCNVEPDGWDHENFPSILLASGMI